MVSVYSRIVPQHTWPRHEQREFPSFTGVYSRAVRSNHMCAMPKRRHRMSEQPLLRLALARGRRINCESGRWISYADIDPSNTSIIDKLISPIGLTRKLSGYRWAPMFASPMGEDEIAQPIQPHLLPPTFSSNNSIIVWQNQVITRMTRPTYIGRMMRILEVDPRNATRSRSPPRTEKFTSSRRTRTALGVRSARSGTARLARRLGQLADPHCGRRGSSGPGRPVSRLR